MESPSIFSGWGRTLRWVLLVGVSLATFAVGYSSVPSLRAAVDKLAASVSDLRTKLTQALGEKQAAEEARDDAESRAAGEKQRAERLTALIAEKDAAIARAESALAAVQRELQAANDTILRLRAELAALLADKPEVEQGKEANAQCPACGRLTFIGQGRKEQRIRCGNCGSIASARTYWARRAFVLDQLNGRR